MPVDRVRVRAGAHLQLSLLGVLQIWWSGRAHALRGIPAELARAIVRRLSEPVEVATLHEELEGGAVVLAALERTGCIEHVDVMPRRPGEGTRVVLLENGRLGPLLAERLEREGISVERVAIGGAASAAPTRATTEVLHATPARAAVVDAGVFTRGEVVVCALEGVAYETLFAVNELAAASKTPCLFTGVKDHDYAFVGPAVSRAASPCLGCVELHTYGAVVASVAELAPVTLGALDEAETMRPKILADRVADETLALLGRPSTSDTPAATRHVIDRDGARTWRSFVADGRCPACRGRLERDANAPKPATRGDLDILAAAASAIGWDWPARPTAAVPVGKRPYKTVAIIGGGSAGWLAALALRALRPELEVSLIESKKIPIIGVGEATTPELVKFLHSPRFLNRRVDDLYRRVRPTWKLGIKFEWGAPAPYSFTYPFQRGRLLESMVYEETLDKQSLGAMLMQSDRAPVFRSEDGTTTSLMHVLRWAYHLDNERFVRWLTEEANGSGVTHIDATVTDVRVKDGGEEVESIVLDGTDVRSFDLYIDCSGFRSLLLEKALKTPYHSYDDTLFTDSAVFAAVPNDGLVRPYTLAETMDNGWCWRIPFEHEDHRGYVYSSKFVSADEACAEMKRKNPRMGDPKSVKFRSGRHDKCWRGNVLAIGNAYAFVEPLESTALHMIVQELELITTHFPADQDDNGVKEMLNRRLADQWDRLRWFLGCHYKFNRRLDTPFWRHARAETNISGAGERVAHFQNRAPLSYRLPLGYKGDASDFFADDHSFDTMLLGQRVPATLLAPVADRSTFRAQIRPLEALDRAALSQPDAIKWLIDERPDVLEDFRTRPDSWIHSWLPA